MTIDIGEIAILTVAVITNLLLLGFVYIRNPRSATNRLFALLVLVMALWGVVNYLSYNVESEVVAKWLVRGVMFLATPMSVIFFLLMHTFPRSTMSLSKRAVWAWCILTVLTMVVAISPLLFPKVELGADAAPKTTAGLGMILFVPVAIGTIPLGIYYLIKKLMSAKGIRRTQIQFLLLGVAVTYGLIICFIFVAVNVYNTTFFVPLAPLFILPFSSLAAYTIIRHRLMDIRAAIARSLSLSILVGAVLLVYGILLIFAVPYITDLTGLRGDVVAAAAALISIPLARYVQLALTKLTDRFLFQKQVDYREALVEIGKELSATIKISDVTNTVVKAMQEIIRSEKTVIFLKRLQGTDFVPVASSGAGDINVSIPPDHVLIKHLKHSSNPLVKDELALQREQEQQAWHVQEIEKVEQTFNWLDISVVAPLYVNNQFTGMIVLGDKLAGTPYMQDDLNFLSALAPQAI